MAKQSKAEKLLDQKIADIYSRVGHGVQINIMDISKIFNAGKKANIEGKDIEQAIVDAIKILRVN